MASDVVQQVREAEMASEEKETAAKAKAAGIIKAAQSEAKAAFEASAASALMEKQKKIEKAQADAEKISVKAQEDADNKAQQLRASCKDKINASVDAVVKHIVP